MSFKENTLPNNWIFTNSIQGTMQFDMQPLKFRFTGSYANQQNPTRGDWRDSFGQHLLSAPQPD